MSPEHSFADVSRLPGEAGGNRLAACLLLALALHVVMIPLAGVQLLSTSGPIASDVDLRAKIIPALPAPSIAADSYKAPAPKEQQPQIKPALGKHKADSKPAPGVAKTDKQALPNKAGAAGSEVEEPAKQEVATPPSGRGINLDRAAATARELARDTSLDSGRRRRIGAGPAHPEPISRDDAFDPVEPLRKHVEKNLRPDCKNAYSGYGLLAIPFLLKDSISDSGCKWQ